jgi:hypothetical protein
MSITDLIPEKIVGAEDIFGDITLGTSASSVICGRILKLGLNFWLSHVGFDVDIGGIADVRFSVTIDKVRVWPYHDMQTQISLPLDISELPYPVQLKSSALLELLAINTSSTTNYKVAGRLIGYYTEIPNNTFGGSN